MIDRFGFVGNEYEPVEQVDWRNEAIDTAMWDVAGEIDAIAKNDILCSGVHVVLPSHLS